MIDDGKKFRYTFVRELKNGRIIQNSVKIISAQSSEKAYKKLMETTLGIGHIKKTEWRNNYMFKWVKI